ncbi:hypothetical protein ACJ72_02524 [Emergomyces africanus]|uniref:Uncharacterized protein n=1 Tax=Emergomyces africanus TaxID=1955775 RepID=A0A1B7P2N6_9EURO|nr:hypothetical protein ACJ72_02524 [Emergomyces africanus]
MFKLWSTDSASAYMGHVIGDFSPANGKWTSRSLAKAQMIAAGIETLVIRLTYRSRASQHRVNYGYRYTPVPFCEGNNLGNHHRYAANTQAIALGSNTLSLSSHSKPSLPAAAAVAAPLSHTPIWPSIHTLSTLHPAPHTPLPSDLA